VRFYPHLVRVFDCQDEPGSEKKLYYITVTSVTILGPLSGILSIPAILADNLAQVGGLVNFGGMCHEVEELM
jgi:hypothetical protein